MLENPFVWFGIFFLVFLYGLRKTAIKVASNEKVREAGKEIGLGLLGKVLGKLK